MIEAVGVLSRFTLIDPVVDKCRVEIRQVSDSQMDP
jgi:hypothetical protein